MYTRPTPFLKTNTGFSHNAFISTCRANVKFLASHRVSVTNSIRSLNVASQLCAYQRRMLLRNLRSTPSIKNPCGVSSFYTPSDQIFRSDSFWERSHGVDKPCLKFRVSSSALVLSAPVSYRFKGRVSSSVYRVTVPSCPFASFEYRSRRALISASVGVDIKSLKRRPTTLSLVYEEQHGRLKCVKSLTTEIGFFH